MEAARHKLVCHLSHLSCHSLVCRTERSDLSTSHGKYDEMKMNMIFWREKDEPEKHRVKKETDND